MNSSDGGYIEVSVSLVAKYMIRATPAIATKIIMTDVFIMSI